MFTIHTLSDILSKKEPNSGRTPTVPSCIVLPLVQCMGYNVPLVGLVFLSFIKINHALVCILVVGAATFVCPDWRSAIWLPGQPPTERVGLALLQANTARIVVRCKQGPRITSSWATNHCNRVKSFSRHWWHTHWCGSPKAPQRAFFPSRAWATVPRSHPSCSCCGFRC